MEDELEIKLPWKYGCVALRDELTVRLVWKSGCEDPSCSACCSWSECYDCNYRGITFQVSGPLGFWSPPHEAMEACRQAAQEGRFGRLSCLLV